MRPLIIVNSFWPGVMGGGPRESLSHLLRDVDIPVFIFTSAFDINCQKLDVIQNSWIEWPPNKKVKVF